MAQMRGFLGGDGRFCAIKSIALLLSKAIDKGMQACDLCGLEEKVLDRYHY
jgi:hypothetical protein